MEKYELIDKKNFDRADYFHYFMSIGTTIEFTAKAPKNVEVNFDYIFSLFLF